MNLVVTNKTFTKDFNFEKNTYVKNCAKFVFLGKYGGILLYL